MEIIRRDTLPEPLINRSTLRSEGSDSARVRVSLYLPAYKSEPARRWRTTSILLEKATRHLARSIGSKNLGPWTELLSSRLQGDDLFVSQPDAQGFAFFLDGEHCSVEELLTPCAPLVVVGPAFHVVPLLQSFASEPHYRIVILEKNRGTIARRDHRGLKTELKVAFPKSPGEPKVNLYPRVTARELSRMSQNISDFSRALINLQALDPRPMGVIGEDRWRRLLIDEVRGSLIRPIFYQEHPQLGAQPIELEELVTRFDEAFAYRVAKQAPCDVAELCRSALREGRFVDSLAQVIEAVQKGWVERLFVASPESPEQAQTANGASSAALKRSWTNATKVNEGCVDDLVEAVLRHDGSVLFSARENETEALSSGVAAILRASHSRHLTH